MSDSDSDSIGSCLELDDHPQPSRPVSPSQSDSVCSLESLLTDSNYEIISRHHDTLSTVNSEDLEPTHRSEAPSEDRSPTALEFLQSPAVGHTSRHDDSSSPCSPREKHGRDFDEEKSSRSSFVSHCSETSEGDSDETCDSLTTLRLSYAFPDPTNTEIPNRLAEAWSGPTILTDFDQFGRCSHSARCEASAPDHLQSPLSATESLYSPTPSPRDRSDKFDFEPDISDLVSSSSADDVCTNPSSPLSQPCCPQIRSPASYTSVSNGGELQIYLLGDRMSPGEMRSFLTQIRQNVSEFSGLQADSARPPNTSNFWHSIAAILSSYFSSTTVDRIEASTPAPRWLPTPRAFPQTRGVQIILHDLTRLSEEDAHLRLASFAPRPVLVVYRVVSLSSFSSHQLSRILLYRSRPAHLPICLLVLTSSTSGHMQMHRTSCLAGHLSGIDHMSPAQCSQRIPDPTSKLCDIDCPIVSPQSSGIELQKMITPLVIRPCSKKTSTKSNIIGLFVIAFLAMLMSWFTIHSRHFTSLPRAVDVHNQTLNRTERAPALATPSSHSHSFLSCDGGSSRSVLDFDMCLTARFDIADFSRPHGTSRCLGNKLFNVSSNSSDALELTPIASVPGSTSVKVWAMRLPRRVRKGIFNLHHHPKACWHKVINVSSLQLSEFPGGELMEQVKLYGVKQPPSAGCSPNQFVSKLSLFVSQCTFVIWSLELFYDVSLTKIMPLFASPPLI